MRIVTVTNQKGGVGKTTLVCHLALAGVERGLRTLVVDLDTQGNASTMLARDAAVAQPAGRRRGALRGGADRADGHRRAASTCCTVTSGSTRSTSGSASRTRPACATACGRCPTTWW